MKRGVVCLAIAAGLFPAVINAETGGSCGSHCVKQQVEVRHGRAGSEQLATQKNIKLVTAGSAATVAMGVEETRPIAITGGRQTR